MELINSLCVVLLQLSVSVSSPGLPVTLPNETYQCHFQNEEMALSFVVPAEEVTANTNYSCNITGQIPAFNGVKAGIYIFFSDIVPFITVMALPSLCRMGLQFPK